MRCARIPPISEPPNDPGHSVSHVSDTALWVAVHRATESKRKDALFRDPYAERLAGERGRQIAGQLEPGNDAAWSIITRTAVLDELIMTAIGDGADTVLNLAAGLSDSWPIFGPMFYGRANTK